MSKICPKCNSSMTIKTDLKGLTTFSYWKCGYCGLVRQIKKI